MNTDIRTQKEVKSYAEVAEGNPYFLSFFCDFCETFAPSAFGPRFRI
ncbi:hypothetical protein M2165_001378 [Variovorax sp. TBS-050B]|nr:hypothetical protein [Variovorax sp. TBS-050B]